jgi:hypothetical protein
MKPRISGQEAVAAAVEARKRCPIQLQPADPGQPARNTEDPTQPMPNAENPTRATAGTEAVLHGSNEPARARRAPPRVHKPLPHNDMCTAPTPDLEAHRARLRETFGNTLSDEFVDVILGKLVEGLRPSPFDTLEESTLNAGLALIDSMQPKSELEAWLAVQIVATGFAGMRFLRQSHRNMTEEYIDVWGGYALRLFKTQAQLIRTYDRHRSGNSQTVEVRHVHIHSGAQGVVGIVNAGSNVPDRTM